MGIKTGTTVTAGPCLTSAYKFRDKIYICTILRATKISRRFK
jgi:D-alanyl-D-alanine carboxypeptidase